MTAVMWFFVLYQISIETDFMRCIVWVYKVLTRYRTIVKRSVVLIKCNRIIGLKDFVKQS